MFVALNHSQLTTKDKEVANSISPLLRPNKYCQNQSRIVINFDNHYQNKPSANHCSNSRPRDIIDQQLRENSIWRTIECNAGQRGRSFQC